MPTRSRITPWLLFFFALSFTFFAIQSGDVLMYLTLVRDHLLDWNWPESDPYLYSLKGAELHIAHEWLCYFIYYGAWFLFGYGGLTLVKMIIFGAMFCAVLRAGPRENNSSPLWMALWMVAVEAGSFRFIERSSIISDFILVLLTGWLLDNDKITRRFVIQLSVLFLLWAQLHPGYPLGMIMIGIWAVWHAAKTPGFAIKRIPWLLVPFAALVINPLGIDGALYPFRFALNEARILKIHNFEWFPTYHEVFRFTPEVIAFWSLLVAVVFLLWREKAWFSLRGMLALFAALSGIMAVRFVPWTSFALLILVKPWARLHLQVRYLYHVLAALMIFLAIKNVTIGYDGSSGHRIPRAGLDYKFFPEKTVEFLRKNPIPGNLYNAHDFGSYLLWVEYKPIFHHGFVTDMNFYHFDVAGVFKDQANFLMLAKKYNWTKLLVDKHGSYQYFHKILSPLTDWKIVAEDESAYLIYLLPGPAN